MTVTIFLLKSLRSSALGLLGASALILVPHSVHSQGQPPETGLQNRYAQTEASSKTTGGDSGPGNVSRRKPGITEITASKEVTFEQSNNKAVFVGDVVVRDPQFILTCQRLTAYLRRSETTEESRAGQQGESGLERAIAEGNVVIIQEKVDAEGKPRRYEGRGQKVVYVTATDQITLSGSPSVREGVNLHVATDPSTVMTITASELTTSGPSKTIIAPSKDD
jgi:lipopolysaccharide transport protein LptA